MWKYELHVTIHKNIISFSKEVLTVKYPPWTARLVAFETHWQALDHLLCFVASVLASMIIVLKTYRRYRPVKLQNHALYTFED